MSDVEIFLLSVGLYVIFVMLAIWGVRRLGQYVRGKGKKEDKHYRFGGSPMIRTRAEMEKYIESLEKEETLTRMSGKDDPR